MKILLLCVALNFVSSVLSHNASEPCSYKCLKHAADRFEASSTLRNHLIDLKEDLSAVCHWYDPEPLFETCEIERKARACFGACGNETLGNVADKILRRDTNCDDVHELADNFACINKSCAIADKKCKDKCNASTDALDLAISLLFEEHQVSNQTVAVQTVAELCRYVGCYVACSNDMFIENCGDVAARVVRETAAGAVRSVRDILILQGQHPIAVPHGCEDFPNGWL